MKIPNQEYTAEFKELAVKRVKGGQSIGAAAKDLGLIEQTLRNWVKAVDARKLRARGYPAGKARVERLMQENGIQAKHKRRFKVTTDSKHNLPIAPNLLEHDFTPSAPNQAFTSDITYLWTDEGWLYLAIVLDLFNREVVGWSLKPRMTADLVTDALTMVWFRRKPAAGLIHHSDRGTVSMPVAYFRTS